MPHGLLVLDFGHNSGVTAEVGQFLTQLVQMRGVADEGHRYKIDADFGSELHVAVVLVRQRGQIHFDARQIDMTAGTHHALVEHGADDALGRGADDRHLQDAVVHQNRVAGMEVRVQPGIVDTGGDREGGGGLGEGEFHGVTRLEGKGLGYVAGADGGPPQVHQDADIAPGGQCRLPHAGGHAAAPFCRGMAHIEPEHVGPGQDQFLEGFEGISGRSEGGDDFGFAEHGAEGSQNHAAC